MLIIGYGEDALTYWAITSQLDKILLKLNDPSRPADATVIYRPSFGRGGGANFGEFDAILGTQHAIYLVESKWDADNTIELPDEQVRRHDIMQWYLKTWRESCLQNWQTVTKQDMAFQDTFPNKKIAPVGSRLAQNLEFILDKLSNCGTSVRNILLFMVQENSAKPNIVPPDSFDLVVLKYPPLVPSGYVQM
ncbi:MAG: hypothetical protein V1899_13010 [Planctomycetota bacterium]